MSRILTKVDYTKLQKIKPRPSNQDQTITHNVRSRVKTEDDFFFFHFSHGAKIGSVYKFLKLQVMAIILVPLFLLYILFLMTLMFGWNRAILKNHVTSKSIDHEPPISIIIPARNEEYGIGLLLDDLSRQRYKNFTVIILDDHSEDNTTTIVQSYIEKDNRFFLQNSQGVGKKKALTQGISAATGSIIVTVDADCRVTENWLAGLSQYFTDENVKMVFGGVKMVGESFFSRLQTLEFVSLMGSGVATAALGLPSMCNGANLAFRKSVFEDVGGYSGNMHIPSGDDEFLMRKILKQYPEGVRFAADPQTVVSTSPNKDIKHFIHQRIRWAGKWKLHQTIFSKALALFVFCFQSAVIFLPLFILLHWINPLEGLLLWFAKVTLEFFFLRRISRFLGVSWSWSAFLLLQFIYPFYVVIIGLVSNFLSFEWKGRKLKSLTVSSN